MAESFHDRLQQAPATSQGLVSHASLHQVTEAIQFMHIPHIGPSLIDTAYGVIGVEIAIRMLRSSDHVHGFLYLRNSPVSSSEIDALVAGIQKVKEVFA